MFTKKKKINLIKIIIFINKHKAQPDTSPRGEHLQSLLHGEGNSLDHSTPRYLCFPRLSEVLPMRPRGVLLAGRSEVPLSPQPDRHSFVFDYELKQLFSTKQEGTMHRAVEAGSKQQQHDMGV